VTEAESSGTETMERGTGKRITIPELSLVVREKTLRAIRDAVF
jgi:hypothetical protein